MFDFSDLHARLSALAERPLFFIGGTAKSGTTWLQMLLDAHPEISCRGEGHFFDALGPMLAEAVDQYSGRITWKNETIFKEMDGYPRFPVEGGLYLLTSAALLMLEAQSKGRAARVLGERTPDNIRCLPLIGLVLPRAKIIHMVRDGRDCAVSAWFHNQRVTPEWAQREFPTLDSHLEKYAAAWTQENAEALAFADKHPEACCRVRYEDLLADTPGELARLYRFLGVSDAETLLAEACRRADFQVLSQGRPPGREDRTSFFRKGQAGDWKNHLSPAQEARFLEITAGLMQRFGYAGSGAQPPGP
ncbi:sulfotransferase domain protein [mine drainage metagenome]|uniref:Sulfotransferase domain protein n=1 Tax=mine drainage metagenome TaxID=410659 RepID=A0A1J5RAM7_9ZZZZ